MCSLLRLWDLHQCLAHSGPSTALSELQQKLLLRAILGPDHSGLNLGWDLKSQLHHSWLPIPESPFTCPGEGEWLS